MKHAALLSLLALAAAGAQAQSFVDNARVRSVEPQYESVQVPREECTSQWINEVRPVAQQPQGTNYGGVAIGAVVGGLLGNQVGKGHGKEAATAAGAVAGAVVGNNIANSGNGYPQQPQYVEGQREVRQCRQVADVQNRLTGYRVNYEYRGQQYSTLMRDNPGPTLQVKVSVEPVQAEYYQRR